MIIAPPALAAFFRGLPRRDLLLLPAISLLTIVTLLGTVEVAGRIFWPQELRDSCEMSDPVLGGIFKPDCISQTKSAEGPWVANAYNDCGYRTQEACGAKPPGALRAALLGTSVARGFLVPYDQTFAARSTALMEQLCRRPVDFQNLGGSGPQAFEKMPLRVPEALKLRPDVVVVTMAPFDLERITDGGVAAARFGEAATPVSLRARVTRTGLRIAAVLRESRALLLAQDVLYRHLASYLPLYLKHGDEADFLRPPFTPRWQHRLDLLAAVLTRVKAATPVPVVLVFLPMRAQVGLLTWKDRPGDVDAWALGRAIGTVARSVGVDYLDMTGTIAKADDPTHLYYPVDGHPTAEGHAILASALVNDLLHQVPAFAGCHPS